MKVRDLIVGKSFIADRKIYKYTMLRGYFNLIMVFIALFYIGLDSYNAMYVFIPWYFLMVGIGVLGVILNRLGFFGFANGLLIFFSNGIVFLFADSDTLYGGIFFFFIGTSLAALTLFSYSFRLWGVVFVLLSIVLGIVAFTNETGLIPHPRYDEVAVKISFLANFILGVVTCSFIVYFLIKENHQSEKELEGKQHQLIRATEELKESKERFEMAVMGTQAGIYEWNLKENSIYISAQWKALLGYDENELIPISVEAFISFIHPQDAQRINRSIQRVLVSHQPYQNELRLLTKSGTYKWFLDSGITKTDTEGNNKLVIGSLIDIDDRKNAEEEIILKNNQLAKTNEELDRFVYSASHDMRAPLSSLLGLIHLSEKTDKIEDLRMYNAMMKDRIRVMEGFIAEVTDYSRNARLDLVPSKFSLFSLVNEVVNNLAYSHVNKKMKIEVAIAPEFFIVTDPGRVKVVLNNLITNANKYQREDIETPFIRITAHRAPHQTLVSVEDNGRGIDKAHHLRIFDMFYRASENSEGSGLGLYIVKETLQKLGGEISVQSEVGVGSTFTFSLPVVT